MAREAAGGRGLLLAFASQTTFRRIQLFYAAELIGAGYVCPLEDTHHFDCTGSALAGSFDIATYEAV